METGFRRCWAQHSGYHRILWWLHGQDGWHVVDNRGGYHGVRTATTSLRDEPPLVLWRRHFAGGYSNWVVAASDLVPTRTTGYPDTVTG